MCNFDYSRLKGRIREKLGTQKKYGEMIGLSDRSVSLKLDNKRPFTQQDIVKSVTVLDITISEIPLYFFCLTSSTH